MSRQESILKQLEKSHTQLTEYLGRLSPADWERPIQDEDQRWTTRQMLIHLVDSQKGMTGQMMRINQGEEAIPPDFDLDRWNKRTVEKNAERTVDDLLAQLQSDYTKLTAFVTSLSDADLDKRGRHSSLVVMSLEEIARLIASHEAEHLQLIMNKLGQGN
jgi:hypothetical protein